MKKRILRVICCLTFFTILLWKGTLQVSEGGGRCEQNASTQRTIVVEQIERKYRFTPTEEETRLLQYLAVAEAQNQNLDGKVAVVEVVLNRLEDERFPNSIKDIIIETGQFSTYRDGTIRLTNDRPVCDADVTEEIKLAVIKACQGTWITEKLLRKYAVDHNIEESSYWKGGALYFSNLKGVNEINKKYIEKIKVKDDIEDHTFWRSY